jgi:hypothetical protein
MRPSLLLLLLPLALGGCNPWKIRYEPRTGAAASPVVRKATRFLPEESKALAQAGGKALGALEIEASGMVVERAEDLHSKAREEAAKHGGTHFLHLENKLGVADLTVINESFGMTLKQADLVSGSKRALYLIVAVPREGWSSLSKDLQPLP